MAGFQGTRDVTALFYCTCEMHDHFSFVNSLFIYLFNPILKYCISSIGSVPCSGVGDVLTWEEENCVVSLQCKCN